MTTSIQGRLDRLERRIGERERPENVPLQSLAELARVYCECERTGLPFPVYEGPPRPGYHDLSELIEPARLAQEAFEAKLRAACGTEEDPRT